MPAAVDRLFQGKTVLCDGAMGTMLYSCGVFINRCYDELNVTQPETVRTVHEQYLQVGAQVIETNTFGANAYRLERYGLREKVREFNLAGAKLARQCVATVGENITEAELAELDAAGVRGVRFNFLKRLADFTPHDVLRRIADKVAPFGWHVVVYFEAPDLAELKPLFTSP